MTYDQSTSDHPAVLATGNNVTALTLRLPAVAALLQSPGGPVMLTRFARLSTGRPRAVLILAAVFFAVAGGLGGGSPGPPTSGGFDDPAAESSKAGELLADEFDTGVPNVVLLVTAKS